MVIQAHEKTPHHVREQQDEDADEQPLKGRGRRSTWLRGRSDRQPRRRQGIKQAGRDVGSPRCCVRVSIPRRAAPGRCAGSTKRACATARTASQSHPRCTGAVQRNAKN